MSAATEITMSQGATLTVSTTIGGVYTAVGGVQTIKWKGKRGTSDVSVLADLQMRKKPKGRGDPGEITVGLQYGRTQFNTLFGYFHAGTQVFWKINTAEASVLGPFFGHIIDMEEDVPSDDPITSPITIDCSNEGSETFAPGP
jgi:hypothetical protein